MTATQNLLAATVESWTSEELRDCRQQMTQHSRELRMLGESASTFAQALDAIRQEQERRSIPLDART